ncbi:hypothetical protein [Rathayibacter sp. VKM Ac-2857]|uniref:hypothetical protein n=1 Tax=Rathayibacter sp. VKM Ac-2857 TaxID=2739020 RepID=UPI001563DE41|nr:hypothetical protein [Rathayibacter sp. VKM Ac-2857]NQX18334.1 hypothetical protein [Rathayibacter sp. VKM Ac-2857]
MDDYESQLTSIFTKVEQGVDGDDGAKVNVDHPEILHDRIHDCYEAVMAMTSKGQPNIRKTVGGTLPTDWQKVIYAKLDDAVFDLSMDDRQGAADNLFEALELASLASGRRAPNIN